MIMIIVGNAYFSVRYFLGDTFSNIQKCRIKRCISEGFFVPLQLEKNQY
jgi:hypothetical protein